ncbi:MAG: hypothetical protein IKQ81_02235 [Clostridiales bacterium]|nr:hypothetical protein [Clostridiales bacterium]
MTKKMLVALIGSLTIALTACSGGTPEQEASQIEASVTTSVEAEPIAETEETTVTEAATENDQSLTETTATGTQDMRTVAEGFIGGSCADLIEAVGECDSLHPAGGLNDNGKYFGYLTYGDFDVEFESDDETYLENGDYSGCTVTAVADTIFD